MKEVLLLGLGLSCIDGNATVTFSFQDAGAEYSPGIPASSNNSISIFAGQTFAFDIWMNADNGELVSGFDFKLNFVEYTPTHPTFTLESNLNRVGSPFTDGFGDFAVNYSEPLTPTNSDPNDPPYGKTLGALLPIEDVSGWRTSTLYLGQATLSIDKDMPIGVYHISPDDKFYGWISYEGEMLYLDNNTFTPYTINVIPETDWFKLGFAIGLISMVGFRLATTTKKS